MELEQIKKICKKMQDVELEDPIKKFIKANGFSPESGDLLILPYNWQYELRITHSNLVYSIFTEIPFLVKKPNQFIYNHNIEKKII